MFTQTEYLQGWLVYGVAALVGLACWWYLLTKIPGRFLRLPLLGVMAALLLMPWFSAEDSHFLAPAWLIAGSEGLFEGPEAFWRAGKPLLVALAAGLTVGVIAEIIRSLKGRNTTKARVHAAAKTQRAAASH